MRILILSNNLKKPVQIFLRLRKEEKIDIWILICNNTKYNKYIFYSYLTFQFIFKMSFIERWMSISLLRSHKIMICPLKLHSSEIFTWIKEMKFDLGLHNMNVIYKQKLIRLFRLGIINPHIGLLPQYRGRSVMEWSILHNSPIGITAFFIDVGIDTGKQLICWRDVDITRLCNIKKSKNYLFSLNTDVFEQSIDCILHNEFLGINEISKGKRYYKMSNLLTKAVEQIIKSKLNK